jgi:hypothetical protein
MNTEAQSAGAGPVERAVRRVVCAAVRHPDGTMLIAPRHFDNVMWQQYHRFGITATERESVQGFVDQWGEFMTREEAHAVATERGQIIRRCGGDDGRLFSENLY